MATYTYAFTDTDDVIWYDTDDVVWYDWAYTPIAYNLNVAVDTDRYSVALSIEDE